jgi:serine/threonine protein kinase
MSPTLSDVLIYLSLYRTHANDFCGSPGFFAPELLLDAEYNVFLVDVWSIGCVMVEIIMGREWFECNWMPVYRPENLRDLRTFRTDLKLALDELWVDIEEHGSKVSGECKSVMRKMLEVEPKNRITVAQLCMHPFISLNHLSALIQEKPNKPRKRHSMMTVSALGPPGGGLVPADGSDANVNMNLKPLSPIHRSISDGDVSTINNPQLERVRTSISNMPAPSIKRSTSNSSLDMEIVGYAEKGDFSSPDTSPSSSFVVSAQKDTFLVARSSKEPEAKDVGFRPPRINTDKLPPLSKEKCATPTVSGAKTHIQVGDEILDKHHLKKMW